MSETDVPTPVVPEVVVVAPAVAPAVAVAVPVPAVVVDLSNKSELVKLALVKLAEAEILADRSDEDKAKFVVEEVKKVVRESSLTDEQKTEILSWCDASLPHVVEAVKLVKTEVSKVAGVALVNLKKCCWSLFSKA
jgi:hypothetical protein